MSKLRSVFVVLTTLAFCLSLALPVEDLPETPYDESEILPYEIMPVLSITVSESLMKAPAVQPRAFWIRCSLVSTGGVQRVEHGTGWSHPICDSLTILDHTLRC